MKRYQRYRCQRVFAKIGRLVLCVFKFRDDEFSIFKVVENRCFNVIVLLLLGGITFAGFRVVLLH